jgi:hypothetical protein
MEMFKNMEVVLVLCFGFLCGAALLAKPQPAKTLAGVEAQATQPDSMPVVIVTGKRLTAEEKAQQDAG